MCKEIGVHKFVCTGCEKVVRVNDFEDIVRWEKKCADCRLIDVTGGFKEVKPKTTKPKSNFNSQPKTVDSLRKEDYKKKSKKKMTKNQLAKVRDEKLGYYK